MTALATASVVLVAAGATAVVLTRDRLGQAIVLAFYGLLVGLMFLVFQAPDVALSQIAVGAVVQPILVLLALDKLRRNRP